MLKLNNIVKTFQTDTIETVALNNINIHVKKGEFVAIMGPSGSGKSTLLNMMGLLDVPSEGRISINDVEISSYKDKYLASIRNEKIGFVFQSFHLINELNVLDNVELPLFYRNSNEEERKNLALEALNEVDLGHRAQHFPNQLSGGQRQRVAIARAIVGKPEILLCDEPTGNLDSEMSREVMNLLLDLNKKNQTTVIMVTHNEEQSKLADRVIQIFDGKQVN